MRIICFIYRCGQKNSHLHKILIDIVRIDTDAALMCINGGAVLIVWIFIDQRDILNVSLV
ncbi:hypothetical protein PAHA111176_13890 [Parendozoicomonas haliclonae]|uniref:Uncharacterized protein n=1 Tax=Parendozoicomonas haliclonae TaxID=1960125 RepID=A0A1X7AID8_9GAMM|nr:hypothetical protein EHSB41UT_01629 [Parendozoicomonas haliclonae]